MRAAPARRLGAFAALLLVGCYDLKKEDAGVELLPDAHGQVSVQQLGIRGHWYAYGDQYDEPRRCLSLGRHAPQRCSSVLSPDPLPSLEFPNHGAVCLTGEAAPVVPCLTENQVECVVLDGVDASNSAAPSGTVVQRTFDERCTCGSSTCTQDGELCYCATNPVFRQLCNGLDDNSNIWGAGIGLDFNLPPSDDLKRHPLINDGENNLDGRRAWNPENYGITGVAFDFSLSYGPEDSTYDPNHNANLRVEFPMVLPDLSLPTVSSDGSWVGTASIVDENRIAFPGDPYPDYPTPSEEHPEGSPFWDAPQSWDKATSPVRQGHNVVHFNEVNPPPQKQLTGGTYEWDPTQLLGIQFHVPTRKNTQGDKFSFCISNLTLVRD